MMLLLFFFKILSLCNRPMKFRTEGSEIESPFSIRISLGWVWSQYCEPAGLLKKREVGHVVGNFLEQQITCIYIFSELILSITNTCKLH